MISTNKAVFHLSSFPPLSRSEAAKLKDTTQTGHRMMVRKRMNCNNFKWFLDNIWPEHFFPDDERFFGKVRLMRAILRLVTIDRTVSETLLTSCWIAFLRAH